MDTNTQHLLTQWQASLSDKERRLYELARVKLKKVLHADKEDGDQGSFFPEY